MSIQEDLSNETAKILAQKWDIRDGRVIPSNDDVALAGGAVKLDATVLYSDLSQSSKLATEFQQRTASKVIRTFLYCMCKLIANEGGTITSFDGDRVMGVFIGDYKNTSAARCALKMNYVVPSIVGPKLKDYFTSLKESGFTISHCVGVDTGPVLAVRAGQRGVNDLVWIGRAPNLAAKLSDIREDGYHSYISADVFDVLHESGKFGGELKQLMWEKRTFQFLGESVFVYRSNWWWKP